MYCEPDCCENQDEPINPDDKVNQDPDQGSLCDLDCRNNIWYQPDVIGYDCKCLLDNLTYDQITEVLQKNPNAAADLKKITSHPTLLMMANKATLVMSEIDDNRVVANRLNRGACMSFYTVFRGNMNGGF